MVELSFKFLETDEHDSNYKWHEHRTCAFCNTKILKEDTEKRYIPTYGDYLCGKCAKEYPNVY
jgi:superfamily II helicase